MAADLGEQFNGPGILAPERNNPACLDHLLALANIFWPTDFKLPDGRRVQIDRPTRIGDVAGRSQSTDSRYCSV